MSHRIQPPHLAAHRAPLRPAAGGQASPVNVARVDVDAADGEEPEHDGDAPRDTMSTGLPSSSRRAPAPALPAVGAGADPYDVGLSPQEDAAISGSFHAGHGALGGLFSSSSAAHPYKGLPSARGLERSSQPDERDLPAMGTRLRGVLDLRGEGEKFDERGAAARAGLDYKHLDWPDHGVPRRMRDGDDSLVSALKFYEAHREPDARGRAGVDVHCKAGHGRTGLFCAAVKVVYEHMTAAQALAATDAEYATATGHKRSINATQQRYVEKFAELYRAGAFPELPPP